MNFPLKMRFCLGWLLVAVCAAGCAFNTHGNRQDDRRLVTRAAELRGQANRRVTLVGTARYAGPTDSRIDLRGGSVELPAYRWPAEYADQPVSVTGTLFEQRSGGARTYRLGEIEAASRWGR
jgi:hypothetical protein